MANRDADDEHAPELPVSPAATRDDVLAADLEERREKRSVILTAVFAGVTGGVVGFPALLGVAWLVGWPVSAIPGWAGALAWVLGSAAIGAYLRWSRDS